jgi:hypothetical protein
VRLSSVIIELVPKKPPAKILPEAKEAFFILAIDGKFYVIDVDAVKSVSDIDAKKEGFYAEGSISDYFKANFKHQRAAIIDVGRGLSRGKRRVSSSDPTMQSIARVADIFSPMKMSEDAPGTTSSSSVEQPVIDKTIDRATEVMGSRDEAMRWLGAPVRALDFATPISILGTKDGVERVSDVLGQMEYGIW